MASAARLNQPGRSEQEGEANASAASIKRFDKVGREFAAIRLVSSVSSASFLGYSTSSSHTNPNSRPQTRPHNRNLIQHPH